MKKKEDAYRLNELLKHLKLNAKQFSQSLGLNRADRIYHIQKGRNGISEDLGKLITDIYDYVSYEWLLTGKGEMLEKESRKIEKFHGGADAKSYLVPLLPISAQAGGLNEFIVSIKDSDYEKVLSPIKGVDFAITVAGDSMAPEFPNGSQIFIKKINERAFIDWGKVYVLDTCNGSIIKNLTPSEKAGFIKCTSLNPDPKYAPYEVALSDIYGIYRVLLCMSIK